MQRRRNCLLFTEVQITARESPAFATYRVLLFAVESFISKALTTAAPDVHISNLRDIISVIRNALEIYIKCKHVMYYGLTVQCVVGLLHRHGDEVPDKCCFQESLQENRQFVGHHGHHKRQNSSNFHRLQGMEQCGEYPPWYYDDEDSSLRHNRPMYSWA